MDGGQDASERSTHATPAAPADWSAAKLASAVIGAPIAAYAVAAAAIAFLPLREPLAFAIGAHAFLPLWITFACALPLARSGRTAIGLCIAITVPCALALLLRSGT